MFNPMLSSDKITELKQAGCQVSENLVKACVDGIVIQPDNNTERENEVHTLIY
jgi:hypothetical protein